MMIDPPRPPETRVFVQPVSKQQAAKTWERAKGRAHAGRVEAVRQIITARETGKRLAPLVRQFLRGNAVRLSAVIRALPDDVDPQTAQQLEAITDPWKAAYERISWHQKRKATGGTRPVCVLPPDLKAVHYMIADALKAQFTARAHIYGVSGKSRDDAARDLKDAQNAGLKYLAKLDIVDCFQSINPDSLYQLPLPKEVIRRALDTRNMTFEEQEPRTETTINQPLSGIPMHSQSESGPRGLLQGSPASNIILAWFLNQIPSPEDVRVFIFADNIAVAARDPITCRETVESLVAYFVRDCPAGPLNLCPAVYAGPGNDPLDFLSYEFDADEQGIGVSSAALSRLEGRLAELDEDETLSDLSLALAIWQTMRNFWNGFAAVANLDERLRTYVDLSGLTINRRRNEFLSRLHSHVFDPPTTTEGAIIERLLRTAAVGRRRRS